MDQRQDGDVPAQDQLVVSTAEKTGKKPDRTFSRRQLITSLGLTGTAVMIGGLLQASIQNVIANGVDSETMTACWVNLNDFNHLVVDGIWTDAFNQALLEAEGSILYIPCMEDKYLSGPVHIPSNITLLFDHGVTVRAVDTLVQEGNPESLFNIKDKENVAIIANHSVFEMNKSVYTKEWNHIFNVNGSTNVHICDAVARDCGGDGFYFGNNGSTKGHCENISLINCKSVNNRRQGLSITSIKGFYAFNCDFLNTSGTSPESGVDIEPNGYTNILQNIILENCRSAGNAAGNGFMVSINRLDSRSERIDVRFIRCRSFGDKYGFNVSFCQDYTKGQIKFIDCQAQEAKLSGFMATSNSSLGVEIIHEACTAINCNTDNNTTSSYGFAASFFIKEAASAVHARATIGNTRYINCTSVDDRAIKLIRRGFAAWDNQGAIPARIVLDNCLSVGHSISPFEYKSTTELIRIRNDEELIIAHLSSSSVLVRNLSFIHTNQGAAAGITLSLPNAVDGHTFSFRVEEVQSLRVKPKPGEQILVLTSGAAQDVYSDLVGSFLQLEGRGGGYWLVKQVIGPWQVIV